jgi:hypothetical protein
MSRDRQAGRLSINIQPDNKGVKMMVKNLTLFFVAVFFILSPVMDVRAEEPLQKEAQEAPRLQEKIEKLEKDIKELKKEAEDRRKEAEARKRLEVTEEEKAEKEKEVLSAAGRRYMLKKRRTLEVEYNFRYSYYSTDRMMFEPLDIEHEKEHILDNTIVVEYAFRDNLTFTGGLPFIYKYEKVGASDSKDVSDVGDIFFGLRWQPFKSGGGWPTTILYANISTDTGQSPYDINIDNELSTGSGFWSFTGGASFSKAVDPVVAFGSLSFSYNSDVTSLHNKLGGRVLKKVEPGNDIGFSMGIGYALSYDVSLTLKFMQNYRLETEYHYKDGLRAKNSAYMTSVFDIGAGWRINPKTTMYIDVGIGLTNDDPDFYLSFRLPFDFLI